MSADQSPAQSRSELTALERRALQLADWIERDRNEPDKIIAYAQDLRRAAYCSEAMRNGH